MRENRVAENVMKTLYWDTKEIKRLGYHMAGV
jgi:hypothetical protein